MSATRTWSLFSRKDQRQVTSSPYRRSQHSSRRAEPHSHRVEAQQNDGWIPNMFNFIATLVSGSSQLDEDDLDLANPSTNDINRRRNTSVRTEPLLAPLAPHRSREFPQIQPQTVNNQPTASGSGIQPPLPPPPPSSNAKDFGKDLESLGVWAKRKEESNTALNEKEDRAVKVAEKKLDERTYEPEKLNFSSRPLPTSLPRSFTFSDSTSLPTFRNNVPSTGAPRKMLKSDPNGKIVWRGAGRARSTPASSRRTPREIPKPDTSKRRRIFEESNDSPSAGVAPAMSTSQSAPAVGTSGSGSNLPMPPRLPRATIIRPQTAPLVSSPLRNVLNSSPPASPPTNKRSTNADTNTSLNTQTRTASILSDMIEKVTPPVQIPDVVNPYQAAMPFKMSPKPLRKRVRDRAVRNKPEAEKKEEKVTENEGEKEKAAKKELSEKEIIEATVPKGAQRSRPPPGLNKRKDVSPEPYSAPIVVELVEEPALAKKTRKVTIEDADEDEGNEKTTYIKPAEVIEPQESGSGPVRASPAPPNNLFASPKPLFGPGKSSLPKEPSKLRKSFLAEEEENDTLKSTETSSFLTTTPTTPLAEVQEKRDPKDIALSMPVSDLPVFKFNYPKAPIALDYPEARAAAKALPISELPTFDFSNPPKTSTPAAPGPSTTSAPVVKAFDFAAAGMKPKAPPSKDNWTCGVCGATNSVEVDKKCVCCEEPIPEALKASSPPSPKLTKSDFAAALKKQIGEPAMPTPPAAASGFNWKAAGIAPKAKSAGVWNCSLCMMENPSTATEKCSICDHPKK